MPQPGVRKFHPRFHRRASMAGWLSTRILLAALFTDASAPPAAGGSAMPVGAVALFNQGTFVQQHGRLVLGALLIFAAQFALIAGLLVERTLRRRAEQQARNEQARYRSVVDTQSEMICRFLPDSTLTFVNHAYCRFWNKRDDELIGRKFIELIPASARGDVLDRIRGLVSGTESLEHPVLLPDGTIGWQHWTHQAIVDERGRLVELQGIGRDITDQKRAEDALGQSEARVNAMLRAIPDLVFVLRRDGTYIDYHARDPKLLYVPPERFLGRKVPDVLPPGLSDLFMNAIEHASAIEDPIVLQYDLPMDEPRHFEARLVRADDDRVLCMVRDVTDMRRSMELNRDLAGRLIASQENERQRIARELHDDLSQKIALLNIEIDQMADQIAGDEARARLHEISMHTGAIASELHSLSHELHPSKLQLIGLAAALQTLCSDVSRQAGLNVIFTHEAVPRDIDPNVSLCLYRIAQEALHNVTRHSHAREARLHLAADGGMLTLHIADPGRGFDPRDAGRHDGLGLISMRERVSFLGGQLAIHTFPGGGTRIGVRVPVSPHAHGAPSASSLSA